MAYGPDYDQDLLTLFEELLYRLAQLLPVPDLGQVSDDITSFRRTSDGEMGDNAYQYLHIDG